jgi:hypothetical protein
VNRLSTRSALGQDNIKVTAEYSETKNNRFNVTPFGYAKIASTDEAAIFPKYY